jgi:hypothetical protein
MTINLHWSSCKVPDVPVGLRLKLNFLDIFSKNTQTLNFMKIRPVGFESCSMRTDGRTYRQTDRHDEANRRFRSFANAPNNDYRVQDVALFISSKEFQQ